jgi:hypothetical protein
MPKAIRMIDVLPQGQHPRTQPALKKGMIFIAFDFQKFSVFDVNLDTTRAVASRSWRPAAHLEYLNIILTPHIRPLDSDCPGLSPLLLSLLSVLS